MSQPQAIYQTQANNPPIPQTNNLLSLYPQIPPDDVRDLLDALMVIRNSTGWGRIEIVLLANDIDTVMIQVTKKRLGRKKPAQPET